MKGGTLQINWHDTKPVLACDFHPISALLATAGSDYDIKLWATVSSIDQKKAPGVTYQSNLSYHSSAVNALRFSPSGEQLASGADGGELILWNLHITDAGEVWKVHKSLVFHRKDVLDLEWSADGAYLMSGSVDNSCIIWDAYKGSVHQILDGHFHYVQGVAWDPLGKYAASISSDRTCRIYINKPSKARGIKKSNYVCQHVISKAESPVAEESKSARSHLFLDETLPSFFRRLAWSPDGSFLLVPSGSHKSAATSESVNTAYVFSRKDLSRPALMLPGASKPVVVVRFCPMKFELLGTNTSSLFKLPYRLIFAVATLNSLYIYDTESTQPIVIVAGVHYAAITDIAWSPAGNYLVLSSQDGYCTLLEFENQELGSPISEEEQVMAENKSPIMEEAMIDDSSSDSLDSPEENSLKEDENDREQASPMIDDSSNASLDSQKEKENSLKEDENGGKQASPMMDDSSSVSLDSQKDKEENSLKEKDENDGKQASPMIEDSSSASLENRKKKEVNSLKEKDDNEGKQASPSTAAPQTKPAKRRITPMPID